MHLGISFVEVCAGVTFPEGRKLRVAVVGGGPAGASAADALTQQADGAGICADGIP